MECVYGYPWCDGVPRTVEERAEYEAAHADETEWRAACEEASLRDPRPPLEVGMTEREARESGPRKPDKYRCRHAYGTGPVTGGVEGDVYVLRCADVSACSTACLRQRLPDLQEMRIVNDVASEWERHEALMEKFSMSHRRAAEGV